MKQDHIWTDAKRAYQEIPIPAELPERIQEGIRQGRARRHRIRRPLAHILGTCAACFALLCVTLNFSPSFAAAAAELPVLGKLFQVLTVRDYTAEENGIHYQVTVPELEADSRLTQQVNEAIQEVVNEHLVRAQQEWEDYCAAFLATGGTEEELSQRSMDVVVDYEIKSQTDTTVSFMISLSESWITAQEQHFYYNLNFEQDQTITLEDLLGQDWVQKCNDAVYAFIKANTDETGFSFFFSPDQGGFVSVDTSTNFYIRSDGTPVLVFPEYSIAAGAAGIVEIPVLS